MQRQRLARCGHGRRYRRRRRTAHRHSCSHRGRRRGGGLGGGDGLLGLDDGDGRGGVEAAERHAGLLVPSSPFLEKAWTTEEGRKGKDDEEDTSSRSEVEWHLIRFFIWSLLMTWHSGWCSLAAEI